MSTFIAENAYFSYFSSTNPGAKVIGENLKSTAKNAIVLKNTVTALTTLNPFKPFPTSPPGTSTSLKNSIGHMEKKLVKKINKIKKFEEFEEFEIPGFKKMFGNLQNEKAKATFFSIMIGPTGSIFAWNSDTGSGSITLGIFRKKFGKVSAAPNSYKLCVPKIGLDIYILHACCNSGGYIGINLEDKFCRSIYWWLSVIVELAEVILKSFKTPSVQPSFGAIKFGEAVNIVAIISALKVVEVSSLQTKPIVKNFYLPNCFLLGKLINDVGLTKNDTLLTISKSLTSLPVAVVGRKKSIKDTYVEDSCPEEVEEFETPRFKKIFGKVEEKKATSIYMILGYDGFMFGWKCGDVSGYIQIGHFKRKVGKSFDDPKISKFVSSKLGIFVSILDGNFNNDGFIAIKIKDMVVRSINLWYSMIVFLIKFLSERYIPHSVYSKVGKICFAEAHILSSKIQELFDNIRLAMSHCKRLLRSAVMCDTNHAFTPNKPKRVPLSFKLCPFSKVLYGLNEIFKFSKNLLKHEKKKNQTVETLISLIKKTSIYKEVNSQKLKGSCREITEQNESLNAICNSIHIFLKKLHISSHIVKIIFYSTKTNCYLCFFNFTISFLNTFYLHTFYTFYQFVLSVIIYCRVVLTIKCITLLFSFLLTCLLTYETISKPGISSSSLLTQSSYFLASEPRVYSIMDRGISYLYVLITPVGFIILQCTCLFTITGFTFNIAVFIYFKVPKPSKLGPVNICRCNKYDGPEDADDAGNSVSYCRKIKNN